jgi:hypothetical protein
MKTQRGFITADFLFSLVLIFGLASVLFAISLTLTVASITQYITYAAARNYVAGHLTQGDQERTAVAKYHALLTNKVFAPLYKGGWFVISATPDKGDISAIVQGYKSNGQDPNLFWGVGTEFTAKILDFNIPFFGSTAPDSDGTGNAFKTYMGSYLGREVTSQECQSFTDQRWGSIQNLSSAYSSATNPKYVSVEDNGC